MSNSNENHKPPKPAQPQASSQPKEKPKIVQNPTGVLRFSEDYDSVKPIRYVKKK